MDFHSPNNSLNDTNSYLQKYFEIKKQISLPVKLKIYFTVFENIIATDSKTKGQKQIDSQKQISKSLLHAFLTLSPAQRGYYLYENIRFIRRQLQKNENNLKNLEKDEIRHVETTCQINFTVMKLSYWSSVTFKLDKFKRQILIGNKKKNIMIDLRLYLVRHSKKHKKAIILQCASEEIRNHDAKKYYFYFENNQMCDQIYEQILKCILAYKNERLLALMIINDKEENEEKFDLKNNDKTLVFLNSKNINEFINYKDGILKKLLITKFDFQLIYSNGNTNSVSTSSSQIGYDLKIQRSLKHEKILRMEQTIKMPSKILKQKFIHCFNTKNKYLLHSQTLQDFSKKYKAIYEKYLINGRIQELISIKEENLSDQEEVLFIKGVENIMTKNYLQYLLVKVKECDKQSSKLIILTSINLSNSITFEVVKSYLLELSEMLFREEKSQNLEMCENDKIIQSEGQEEFKTVYGGFDTYDKEQLVEFVEADDQFRQNEVFSPSEENSKLVSSHYLFKKHLMNPVKGLANHKKLMSDHYLFKEWERRKNGGVICVNERIINQQKKIFKSVLTMMKNNLLSGGSILNISLPVNIFKKQSHLVSIGRDFCYAPLFFDRIGVNSKPDRLERMKYATLLCISVGTLGISMDKPFNPILGETLQLWLGGCPMYLEQISHHPPIGSYYLVGRGYKVHGQIEPKISLGMNSVKGYSERKNFVIFEDDYAKIQLSYGKMIIKGMLFGERQFNFEEKIFAYDQTNHLFSQICYGPKKKGMIMKSSEPDDFVFGKIYKLKPEFLNKFKTQPCYPSKEFIVSELSEFEGIWNDVIKFDGVQYVNFRTDLPCELQYDDYPLASNSTYRTDLIKLMEDTVEEAQKEKERLEELQRRDRRLRQNMSKLLFS